MKKILQAKKYAVLSQIEKRDGMIVPFDGRRIVRAILRAMQQIVDFM